MIFPIRLSNNCKIAECKIAPNSKNPKRPDPGTAPYPRNDCRIIAPAEGLSNNLYATGFKRRKAERRIEEKCPRIALRRARRRNVEEHPDRLAVGGFRGDGGISGVEHATEDSRIPLPGLGPRMGAERRLG